MRRLRSVTPFLLGGLAVILAAGASLGATRIASTPDSSEPARQTKPSPGIRAYGPRAERLELPRTASLLERVQPSPSASSGRAAQPAIKISGLPMAGSVRAFTLSPDGTTAVYVADQATAGIAELYSAPIDGSAAPTKISAGVTFGAGDSGVDLFQISPDGSTVAFLADAAAGGGSNDLYSVPIDGSMAPVRINSGNDRPVTGLGFTPTGARVAYFGKDTANGTSGAALYRATPGTASSGIQLSDAGATNTLANVVAADFSPDGSRAIYAADATTDETYQWFSVPMSATGPGSDVQLSAALGSVILAKVSPDGSRVVYTGDGAVLGVTDVYSVPNAGGTRVRLSQPMAGTGATEIAISPDGTRVGYLADQNTDGVIEVYSAPIATAASGTRLSAPMSGLQYADSLGATPDGAALIYEADQETPGTHELFRVPIAGGTAPLLLHDLTTPDEAGFFSGLGTPIIGGRVVYPVVGSTIDVYSVPDDGTTPPLRVNEATATGTTLRDVFLPSAAQRLMAYGSGSTSDSITRSIAAAAIRGDLPIETINTPAAGGSLGVLGYEIATSEDRAVFLQDADTGGKPELYSVALDSDDDGVVNGSDNCPFVSNAAQAAAVFGQTVIATSTTRFSWPVAADARYVRGPLASVAGLGYDVSGTLTGASSLADATMPAPQTGLFYLFAPDCPGRSYQTAPGSEPARDSAGLP